MEKAREDLLTYLAKGMTRRAASAMAGIDEHQVRRWETGDEQYAQRIHAAETLARAVMEERIFAASQDDWRAAAWYLERRDRENWGKHQQVELSGPAGGAIPVQFQDLSTDELRKLARGDANPNA